MSQPLGTTGQAPRFLTDMNFNARIVTGLRRRAPSIDLVTVQDLGLQKTPDPALLAEAQRLDRILLTHDINTMPGYFADFLASLSENEHSPGVMLVAQGLSIGVAIQELYMVWACSPHEEWRDRFTYLPL
jgi:predicted nuclease of predicted toxin-antitoxin system